MTLGTHLNEAKILRAEQRRETTRAGELEQQASSKGWNIKKSLTIGDAEYCRFLESLLEEEVLDTGEVLIVIAEQFRIWAGEIWVDHRKSLTEIIAYIKE